MSDSWISCGAYARRRGVSAMSVSEAIKNGRLVKSVVRVNGLPKISDPDLADAEWEANTDISRRIAAAGGVVAPPQFAAPTPKAVVAPPKVPESVVEPVDLDESSDSIDSIATATQREKHWKANLAELKFKEAAGELVPVADVKREWTGLLSHVRGHLLGLPTRLKQAIPVLTVKDVGLIEKLVREALEELVESEVGE